MLLGDGHIDARGSKTCSNANARFHFAQTTSKKSHINYFYHVFDIFKPYIVVDREVKERIFITKNTTKQYKSISFSTMALPLFNKWAHLFYKTDENGNRKKRVPCNINELLTKRGLAYWIMDDGSAGQSSKFKAKTGLHLNTYGFIYSDVLLLENILKEKFNLKTSIHKHNSGYRIYIWEKSMILLTELVDEYIIDDMLYKIKK